MISVTVPLRCYPEVDTELEERPAETAIEFVLVDRDSMRIYGAWGGNRQIDLEWAFALCGGPDKAHAAIERALDLADEEAIPAAG